MIVCALGRGVTILLVLAAVLAALMLLPEVRHVLVIIGWVILWTSLVVAGPAAYLAGRLAVRRQQIQAGLGQCLTCRWSCQAQLVTDHVGGEQGQHPLRQAAGPHPRLGGAPDIAHRADLRLLRPGEPPPDMHVGP